MSLNRRAFPSSFDRYFCPLLLSPNSQRHRNGPLRQGASHDVQRRNAVDGAAGIPSCRGINARRCAHVCRTKRHDAQFGRAVQFHWSGVRASLGFSLRMDETLLDGARVWPACLSYSSLNDLLGNKSSLRAIVPECVSTQDFKPSQIIWGTDSGTDISSL